MILVGLALASPELLETRVWSSPFMQEGARPRFVERELSTGALEVGVMGEGLRIYVEEEPGEPWTGPLTVVVDGTLVAWEAPSAPRSTPNRTIYEARLSGLDGGSLVFEDGPAAGQVVELPEEPLDEAWYGLAAALVLVMVPLGRKALRRT